MSPSDVMATGHLLQPERSTIPVHIDDFDVLLLMATEKYEVSSSRWSSASSCKLDVFPLQLLVRWEPVGWLPLPADRVAPPTITASRPDVSAAEPFVAEAVRWLPDDDPDPPTEAPSAVQGRILVADDNTDMRQYLARLLRPRYGVHAVGVTLSSATPRLN